MDGESRSRRDVLFVILGACLFAVCCVLLFRQCRFGFPRADEAFYLTVPLRLVRGDALFADEWHLSQMASFLLLPILYPYLRLTGTTAGIVLAFRYVFTAVWIAGSAFVFWRMRRISRAAAYCAALALVLFAPFCIMALSYNSLGVLNLTLSTVLLCTAPAERHAPFYAAGVFFAAAVLCCPYLLAVFLLYAVVLLVFAARRRTERRVILGAFLRFSAGAAALAALFAAFVFSRASLREILDALPWMLADPEHTARTVWQCVHGYCGCILGRSPAHTVPAVLDTAALVCAWLAQKQNKTNLLRLCFGGVLLSTAAWFALIWFFDRSMNFLMLPMQVFPLFALCVSRDAQAKRLFLFGEAPALLYSVCIYLSSNTGLYAIALACAVSLPVCTASLGQCMQTLLPALPRPAARRCLAAAAACVVTLQIGLTAAQRFVFDNDKEPPRSELTATVTSGPCRDVRARPQDASLAQTLESETASVRKDPSVGTVLYLSVNPVLYLTEQDARMGSYSAWLSGLNASTLERLEAFYALRPEKIPQAVYYDFNDPQHPDAPKAAYAQFAAWLCDRFGFVAQPTESGNVWFLKEK